MAEFRACRACGRQPQFVKGENGKIIPLDRVSPVFEVIKDLAGQEVAKRVGSTIMVTHFATCPAANDFSGSKKK